MTHQYNGLGGVLFIAGIVIVLISPRKLATLGRMAAVFIALIFVLLVAGALFKTGDPEMLGALSAQVALGAADAVGALHVRSLKRRPNAP